MVILVVDDYVGFACLCISVCLLLRVVYLFGLWVGCSFGDCGLLFI